MAPTTAAFLSGLVIGVAFGLLFSVLIRQDMDR